MHRKRITQVLAVAYSALLAGSSVWAAQEWQASAPTVHAEVKGISTEPAQTETNALAYPHLTVDPAHAIQADYYALYSVESGRTVASRQPDKPVAIASTTKLMTAYTIERLVSDLEVQTTVSSEAANQPADSSLMGIHTGETISLQSLLYGALLVSGNDAAYALGEYGGGLLLHDPSATPERKTARFVEEMNRNASLLHMVGTNYRDCIGFNDGGRSTARGLAKLVSRIITSPVLSTIISTPTTTVFGSGSYYRYDLRNSNRLITDYQYTGSLGGKTGYTVQAGHCLVSSATRDGKTFVAVILHTYQDTNEASAVEARKLLDLGFSATQWR